MLKQKKNLILIVLLAVVSIASIFLIGATKNFTAFADSESYSVAAQAQSEFAGGSGTASDPYLIENEEQLRNIEKVSMSANYKLNADITLSLEHWVPIGGYYKERPFTGVFDGNGRTIYNLKRSDDIAEYNNRFYFGLFGYIGVEATVKNLTLSDVAIAMDGPEVNNANARVFVGALAGSVYGTVENVSVYGKCSYDVCTNGTVFTGCIAGVAYNADIKNCENHAEIVSGRYAGVAGGIVGYANGANIENCTNYGSVLAKCTGWGGHASAGQIVGEKSNQNSSNNTTDIRYCTKSGTCNCTYYSWGIGCQFYMDKDGMFGRDNTEPLN